MFHVLDTPTDNTLPKSYVVVSDNLLYSEGDTWTPLLIDINQFSTSHGAEIKHCVFIGQYQYSNCYAVEVGPLESSQNLYSLRHLLMLLPENLFNVAGRAMQLLRWLREHKFCGVCGAETRAAKSDRARVCVQCETRYYPRISPCVIGLIERGDKCLLAHGNRMPEGVYSCIAGFIEAGETAEMALIREAKEEVSIEIVNLRYIISQPWPFPGQLMLGFSAEYSAGEILVDNLEISEADWFSVGNMPMTPPKETISGKLIQNFIDKWS